VAKMRSPLSAFVRLLWRDRSGKPRSGSANQSIIKGSKWKSQHWIRLLVTRKTPERTSRVLVDAIHPT
jgi:hypothetical protein